MRKGEEDDDQPWPSEYEAETELAGQGVTKIDEYDVDSTFLKIRKMRLQAKTVQQISEALQIKPARVKQAITNLIKAESAALDDDELMTILQLEMDRIDYGIQTHWEGYLAGDMDSAKFMMMASRERREWLKWAKPENTADVGITQNVLVVGGNESDFLATLAAARERLESEHSVVDAEVVDDGQPDDA